MSDRAVYSGWFVLRSERSDWKRISTEKSSAIDAQRLFSRQFFVMEAFSLRALLRSTTDIRLDVKRRCHFSQTDQARLREVNMARDNNACGDTFRAFVRRSDKRMWMSSDCSRGATEMAS
ncbi:hypothetical protein E1301_Tti019212 [Triplophysa tibetana]|uniref:Uncharacterized protein n=1 Tax=Triplophysa tibetana TaxID=1572043 RepID=A0A5A9PBF5_9TELE|nr:hypothetical protein E1301_Tti019212 [Triplophysa tibetana]